MKDKKKNYSLVGSLCWMAPEMLDDNEGGYDEKVDIWSIGITAYELAYGKPPYSENTSMKAIMLTMQDEPPKLSKSDGWDSSFIDLVESCLQKNPANRKSAKELLKSKFLSKAKSNEYLREKLFSRVGLLESFVTASFKKQALLEIEQKKSAPQLRKCNWDFSIEEEESFQDFDHLPSEES